MQVISGSKKIFDDDRKDSILLALSDKYCRTILYSTVTKPKSAYELSKECNVSVGTIYRRIKFLKKVNLLRTSSRINQNGTKTFLHQSKVESINSRFSEGKLSVEIVLNQEVKTTYGV